MNQTWSRLKPLHKAGIVVAALALAGGGSAVAINAFTSDDGPPPTFVAPAPQPSDAASSPAAQDGPADDNGVRKRTVTETEAIKFKTRTVKDNWLPKGEKERLTAGIDGVRTLTYTVTLVDGKETGRKLVSSKVTRKPVDEVTSVGTATAN
jgi:resuscitation-promoting factor RpfB